MLLERYNTEYSTTSKPREIFVTLRARGYNLNFTYGQERVKHICTNGIVPRTHRNKGKMPKDSMKSSTEEVNILKTDVSIDLQEWSEVIPPPGIPPEWQKYLYEQIKNVL